ncbi:MAG: DUF393 domain-containing protein [Halobacteriovoraceae bacterium]|nr:DUF393 domain-containing protein [Halobacteriovoraceae bacterium]
MKESSTDTIIFFDGVCALCNGFVDWLFRVDNKGLFKVAALQGQTAKRLLSAESLEKLESILVLKEGRHYQKSSAVLLIMEELGYPWKLLGLLRWLPLGVRDWFYDKISVNRFVFHSKLSSCRLPGKKELLRFLP